MQKTKLSSLLLILYSTVSFASSNIPGTIQHASYAGKVAQVFLVLAGIIILIFACTYFLKRFTLLGKHSSGTIKLLYTMPIGTREKILLIQAGETQLLVGACAGQLRTLHVFDEPITQSEDNNEAMNFSQQLKKYLGQGKSS